MSFWELAGLIIIGSTAITVSIGFLMILVAAVNQARKKR